MTAFLLFFIHSPLKPALLLQSLNILDQYDVENSLEFRKYDVENMKIYGSWDVQRLQGRRRLQGRVYSFWSNLISFFRLKNIENEMNKMMFWKMLFLTSCYWSYCWKFRTNLRTRYNTVCLGQIYVNLRILTYMIKWDVPCLVVSSSSCFTG